VQALLAKGADVNIMGSYGTALMEAIFNNHLKVVEVLLSKGADVNVKRSGGMTALKEAKFFGEKDIIALLKNAKTK